MTISEVPNARPFAFVAGAVACVPTRAAAAALLNDGGPLGPVILQTDRACPAASSGSATVETRVPERIDLSVTTSAPTVLVLLQTYTRDWTATIDGTPSPIMPADIQFQAVAVLAGSHHVTLAYAPAAVRLGAIVTGISLLVTAGVFVLAALRRRPRSALDTPSESP